MRITVLPHKHIPSPEADDFAARDADALPSELGAALTAEWSTDAHFAAYEPLCPPELEGAAVRLASGALADGLPVRMVALVGDVDDADAHREKRPASKEWRATTEPVLRLSGLAHYETRGGYRVIAELADPVELRSPEDARLWSSTYRGWCEQLRTTYGLTLDVACADWTRLYRLPNVVRDGAEQRAPIVGAVTKVDAYAIPAQQVTAVAPSTGGADDRDLTDRERGELDAAAALIAEHFETGKRHLMALAIGGWLRSVGLPPAAAEYVVGQLPSDAPEKRIADATKAWTKSGPVEGWAALRRYVPADTLAKVQALAVGPSSRKALLERMAARNERPATAPAADADPLAALGRRIDLSVEPKPLDFICEALGIAPGKITTIAGYAGTGKGPLINLFTICVAAGLPFLGMPVRRARVLLWDCETGPLLQQRLHRIANALGVDLVALERDGWLVVIEGQPPMTDAHVEAVRSLAVAKRVELLAIDSYTSAFLGLDQNSAEYSGPAFALGALSSETGCAVLITTHDRKSTSSKGAGSDFENQSGHNSLQAAQQASVRLVRPNPEETTIVELRCGRHPGKGFAPICIRWDDVTRPDAGGGRYGQLKAEEWGLQAVHTERPSADDGVDLEAEEIDRRVMKYLLGQPCPIAMRSIQKNVRGKGETYIKDRLLLLVERGLVVSHSHANAGNGRTHETFECGKLTPEQRLRVSG